MSREKNTTKLITNLMIDREGRSLEDWIDIQEEKSRFMPVKFIHIHGRDRTAKSSDENFRKMQDLFILFPNNFVHAQVAEMFRTKDLYAAGFVRTTGALYGASESLRTKYANCYANKEAQDIFNILISDMMSHDTPTD